MAGWLNDMQDKGSMKWLIMSDNKSLGSGWWLSHPSELIWQSVAMILPNIWKNKKCSKPPIGKSLGYI